MDSCLKLVSYALNAILKWAHLHNKQSCEKDLAAVHWLSDLVLVAAFGSIWISRISNWISFQLFSKPMKEHIFLKIPCLKYVQMDFPISNYLRTVVKVAPLWMNTKMLKSSFKFRLEGFSSFSERYYKIPLALKKEFRGNIRWYFVRAITLIMVNYHFHIKELAFCIDLWKRCL